jgi:hypothetical protein
MSDAVQRRELSDAAGGDEAAHLGDGLRLRRVARRGAGAGRSSSTCNGTPHCTVACMLYVDLEILPAPSITIEF